MPLFNKLSDFKVEELLQNIKRQDACAMYILANKYLYADELERDIEEGIIWLKKSYELGNIDATRALGYTHAYDFYGNKNCQKSIELLQSAARCGDIKSKHYLAIMYVNGICLNKNIEIAYKLLSEAYSEGHYLSGVIMNSITTTKMGLFKCYFRRIKGISVFLLVTYHHFKGDLGEKDRLWNLTTFSSLKDVGFYKQAKVNSNTQLDML